MSTFTVGRLRRNLRKPRAVGHGLFPLCPVSVLLFQAREGLPLQSIPLHLTNAALDLALVRVVRGRVGRIPSVPALVMAVATSGPPPCRCHNRCGRT